MKPRLLAPDGHRASALSEREISPSVPPYSSAPEFNLVSFLRILSRRKHWIYVSVGGCLLMATIVCLVMTPRYRAGAQLQILKHTETIAVTNRESPDAEDHEDALDFNLTLQTQVAVLNSETLALRVIKELNLADTKEFRYSPRFHTAEAKRQMALPMDETPVKRAYALRRWFKNLDVRAVAGTRLITVSYIHSDPATAALIVNQLVSDFIDYNYQVRRNAISQASGWLDSQVATLREQVAQLQQRAAQLQKETGIYGTDETRNVVLTRLEQLNTQVAAAQATRYSKEAIYKLAREGNPEVVANLLGGATEPGGTTAGTTVALLVDLRRQETTLEAQYAEAASKYGTDHPRLIQIREQLNAVRANLKAELNKVADRARNEYALALSAEAAAQNAFQQQKALASKMNDRTINFVIAKREADSNRQLYEHLLQTLKETGVIAGLHPNTINVVNSAMIPDHPARPNIPLYFGFAGLAGLTLGIVCAFLSESMDCTLRNPEEIEATTSVPVLGIVPRAHLGGREQLGIHALSGRHIAGRTSRLELHANSNRSLVAESFRAVRASLLLSSSGNPAKVIMLTSGLPFEGKTFVALNLAAVLSQTGSKVLLVDADLRHSSMSRHLQWPSSVPGLAQLLLQDSAYSQELADQVFRPVSEVPGLSFLGSGIRPSATAELLGSKRMAAAFHRWREMFDFIVIDTPPVLALTDAVVLSPNVDAVLLVVRFAVSTRQSVARVIRTFRDIRVECRGAIVNAMDIRSTDYFQYSGAYADKYSYGYAELQTLRAEDAAPPRV